MLRSWRHWKCSWFDYLQHHKAGIQQVLMVISLGFSPLFSTFPPKTSFLYLIYTGGWLSFSGTAFPFSDSECLQHTCKEKYCLSRGIAILNKRSPKVEITSNNVKFSGLKQYQCVISPISVSLLSPARQSLWPTWHWQGCSCLRSQLEPQVVWDFPSGLIHTPSNLHSHLPTVSAHFLKVWRLGLRRVKLKATRCIKG